MRNTEDVKQRLYRRKDSAKVLGVSESQTIVYERRGLIQPIRLPGIRAVRHDANQVDSLADRVIAEAKAGR